MQENNEETACQRKYLKQCSPTSMEGLQEVRFEGECPILDHPLGDRADVLISFTQTVHRPTEIQTMQTACNIERKVAMV